MKKVRFSLKEDIEPQEIFLDNLAKKKEAELGISERKVEIPLSKKILQGFLLFIICLVLVLFGKTFQFQVLEHKNFLALAKENKFIFFSIKSARGVIYDSAGNQLVFNKPSFDLILDKNQLPESNSERERILNEVSLILEENIEDLKEKINQGENNLILISENLDHQKLIILETKVPDLQGFRTEKNTIREYKDGQVFAHLIGYTGKITGEELKENPDMYSGFDYVGRIGVEKSYEQVLRKNPGKIRIGRDVLGDQISKEIISMPESGNSLVLWLDSELQKKLEQELKKALENTGAKKAVAVALNPKNGGVLALVSLPGYDNNLFSKEANPEALLNLLKDKEEPLFNRAIAGKYPTGSTIKPLIAAAALEEEVIQSSKKINCQGKISVPHEYDPEIVYEYHDWTTHSWTDVRKAIAESCNVYFFTIGGGYENQKGLGPLRIKKYLELFGWGNKTEIDLPSESKGFIPSREWKEEYRKENWWDGDTYNLSVGQGDIMITPLQVAASFVAVANGGVLYKPKVVKEIVDKEKNIIEEIKPEIIRKGFISSENLQVVREGMRKAVTGIGAPHASSVLLNSLPVPAAAKTGTAETSIQDSYHNWITVFAPYDDPQIVLTIMVENVQGVRVVALPIAQEVLNWYFMR